MNSTELPSIAAHAKSHGITPQKKLGQNFIFDSSLCDKIVRTIPSIEGRIVLEIGPGPGGLTRAILSRKPAKLIVIEKDPRCIELLQDIQKFHLNLEIIQDDALKIKLPDLIRDYYDESSIQEGGKHNKIYIISNLPYNIGTELVFRWLEYPEVIESMTLMLQKEVVDRICSKSGSKTYGKLSVMCQLLTNAKKEFDVSPAAFYPPPKVHSAIVTLTPQEPCLGKELVSKIRAITHEAFTARRKMLKTSLKSIPDDVFKKLNIVQTARPEDLNPDDYLAIALSMI